MIKYSWINKNQKYILIGIFLVVFIIINWIIHKIRMKYLHTTLLDILKKSIPIFHKHNINYWAIGGTLLANIREGRIIEHDDDIDIGIFKKDYLRIKNLKDIKDDFNNVGLEIVTKSPPKNLEAIKIMNGGKGNNYNSIYENKIYIDLFPFDKIDNKYIYSEKESIERWPNAYFLDDEIFPLGKSRLNDVEINIPNKSVLYLERLFGNCKNNNECWKIPKVTHNHLDEINISLFHIIFK